MRIRTVPQIMAKTSNRHATDISLGNFQLRLCLLQLFRHFERQIRSPDGMFKSLMCRSWEHIGSGPKLKQITQPLKLPSVYDLHQVLRQLNVAMHRVHIGRCIFLFWAFFVTLSTSRRHTLRMRPRLIFKLAREMCRVCTRRPPRWRMHPSVLVLRTYGDCMIIL